ncbi:hypothetical protein QVZ41_12145 [Wenyingzhuangia sp. chi5]|uniref:Uncharacterized protein n=1 Tax=Wenyingzhuangia gilva TaxID=3057677 RepID=A0ABT8VUF2_9FLAO|nr:hypothetical protein [Wenyingzhuangia sp. chi5]MDO3695592.1 hypothetical protein [Wenyingzhuangia sp. chi5]
MKTLFIALLISINSYHPNDNCDHLNEIRDIFQAGVNNKEELAEMIAICKKYDCDKITPYYAAATMRKAEFVWSPLEKLSNFNKGKKMLESFIKEHPNNIEAKYIRWLTQKMAPKFLGYHENIKEDYDYIQKNITKSDLDKEYQKVILNHIQKMKHE